MLTNTNKAIFIDLIYDYEQNPDKWNFKGKRPAVLYFHAPWCGVCLALDKVITQMAQVYEGKVDFYSIDVAQESELNKEFGARTVPSLLFIPTTGSLQRILGMLSKPQFESILNSMIH